MKSFAFFVCAAALIVLAHGLTEEEKATIKDIHAKCQQDPATRVDEDVLQKSFRGEDVQDPQAGIHILCMSKRHGFQKANGNVDKTALKKGLASTITDATKLDQAVDKCGVQKGTPEATAEHLMKCYHDYVGHVLHEHSH